MGKASKDMSIRAHFMPLYSIAKRSPMTLTVSCVSTLFLGNTLHLPYTMTLFGELQKKDSIHEWFKSSTGARIMFESQIIILA
jgi:hypothetical protein